MKLITRDTDYAVRALCFIAQSKERVVPVSTLVDKLRIPRPFLRQILQELNKNGVLKSYKGTGGGFQLVILPQQIFLADLIKIFQGPLKINECIFKKKLCPNRNVCILRKKINSIEREVIAELGSITVASLVEPLGMKTEAPSPKQNHIPQIPLPRSKKQWILRRGLKNHNPVLTTAVRGYKGVSYAEKKDYKNR